MSRALKDQQAASVLVLLKNFEIWGHKQDIEFDCDDKDLLSAQRYASKMRQLFVQKDIIEGYENFVDQLLDCLSELNQVSIWLRHKGFNGTRALTLEDLDKCPHSVDIIGILKSLPLSEDPTTGLHDQHSLEFAKSFAEKYISGLLKQKWLPSNPIIMT